MPAETFGAVIRDPFDDPFPDRGFDPRWRTETVTALTGGIDRDRAFDRMPVTVDALEEAGCVCGVILGHCRDDSSHARDCWVVDRVLTKALRGLTGCHAGT